ncbi:unnamed protein product [Adineta steineri]|uniref:Uncharacterized protein n=1 Tax=Adineta steineri TaxID=433720 RepID=A0A819FRT8_9BILA|nr:unnamed protein product [Adineta steineri]CAF3870555.1 unnamed protein product [Adineta steineri]
MGIRHGKQTNLNTIHYESLLAIDKYQQIPIVSLEQAVKPLMSILPTIQTYVQMVKQKCLHPSDGLTIDESASIMLYSIIWQPYDQCLYILLNSTLPKLNEYHLRPWFLYLKLLFTALIHLPSNHLTVYRGSKSDLSKQYQINDIILWGDLPLCTTSIEYLQSDKCLGNIGIRTIFRIECRTVKNIYRHCYFQLNNFVLFLPATKFKVIEYNHQNHDNLHVITLQEIESSFLLHSVNQMKLNLNTQIISLNIFRRFLLPFKKPGNPTSISNDNYRNTSLEHRISEYENSWTVDLDRQNLTDRDMNIVVKYAIIKNRCKRVRLRDNYITCQGSSILSEGLYNNTTLESLDLRNNQISDLGVQYLSSSIIYANIKTLNLESNEITAEGAQYLAQMLKDNRTITEIYLSKNRLGDQGIELIANALSNDVLNLSGQPNKVLYVNNPSTLQHLYIGQNEITDEGLKHLSNMLKTNRTLTWLWLAGNDISNQGVEVLSNILADYNISIEWLFLNSNKLITDASIDALLNMLKRNNTLKTLYINNCNLSDITKRKLLKMMKTKKDFDLEV